MKKCITFILSIVLMAGIFIMPTVAAGTGSISATGSTGKQGDTVTVTVNLTNNPGLITMKFQVEYGSDLELKSVTNAGLLNGWTQPSPTISSPYTIRWADSLATTNNTATGKLVTLTFKIKDNATVGDKDVTITFNESRDAAGGKNTFGNATAIINVSCKNHSYGSYIVVNNTQHKRTCSVCSNVETNNHNWNSGSVTKAATCKETGVKTFKCTTCGATKTETIAKTNSHKYGSYTNVSNTQHKRTCSVCGKVETTGHNWNSGSVTKVATCKETGVKTFKCTNCGATKTETVAKTNNHNYSSWSTTTAATCTEAGTETRKCTICGKSETRSIAALGHSFSNPTITKKPTCTETGIETGKCKRCNKTTTSTIKATGHKFGEWIDDQVATCIVAGTQKHVCSVCNQAESRTVDALNHDFEVATVVKEPTISTPGLKEGKCKNCGETTSEIIPCSATDVGSGIVFEAEEGAFPEGATISVSEITDEADMTAISDALADVSSVFNAYHILAQADEAEIQPDGNIKITFNVPGGYSKDIGLYSIIDGVATKLEATVSEDGKTITVVTASLGDFAICDLSAEKPGAEPDNDSNLDSDKDLPSDNSDDNEQSNAWIIWLIVGLVVAVIAGVVVFVVIKKKKEQE